jgi:hypothetical protein
MMNTWIALLCLVLVPGATQEPGVAVVHGHWTADSRDTWREADGEPRLQINLRAESGESRWGAGVRPGELAGLPAAAWSGVAHNARFAWTREAGTFRFAGSFDDGRGAGTFTFTPDATYLTGMASLGYAGLGGDEALRLAVIDVTQAFVRDLRQTGYATLPLSDVVRFRVHGVTAAVILELGELGYADLSPETLVRMAIHRATPEAIRALREAGLTGLSADEAVRLAVRGPRGMRRR